MKMKFLCLNLIFKLLAQTNIYTFRVVFAGDILEKFQWNGNVVRFFWQDNSNNGDVLFSKFKQSKSRNVNETYLTPRC